MTTEQRDLRDALARLAEHEGGRKLLQLSLQGIESGRHDLAAGCWTSHGEAGCLFQQAYWHGREEGLFDDDERVRAWISGVAGRGNYGLVIDVIAAFDRLARSEFAIEKPRFRRPLLDQPRWRAAVTAALVDTLGSGALDRGRSQVVQTPV